MLRFSILFKFNHVCLVSLYLQFRFFNQNAADRLYFSDSFLFMPRKSSYSVVIPPPWNCIVEWVRSFLFFQCLTMSLWIRSGLRFSAYRKCWSAAMDKNYEHAESVKFFIIFHVLYFRLQISPGEEIVCLFSFFSAIVWLKFCRTA